MKAIALLPAVALVALAGCGEQGVRPARRAPERTYTDLAAKIAVAYPAGWHAADRPVSHVTSPKQRLAIATFPLGRYEMRRVPVPAGSHWFPYADARAELPDVFPAGQALVYVQEFGGRYTPRDPPRPLYFSYDARSHDFGLAGCTFGRSWPEFGFVWREKGRTFAAELVIGAHASARTRGEALAILNSVSVGHRPTDVPEPTS